jgi:hypothetical protein
VEVSKVKKIVSKHDAGGFGFHTWNLATEGVFEELTSRFDVLLKRMIEEGLELAAAEYEASIYCLGDDPLEISIELPLGESEFSDGPRWKVSLRELVELEIELAENQAGEPIEDEEGRGRLMRMRAGYAELIETIDNVLARKHPDEAA